MNTETTKTDNTIPAFLVETLKKELSLLKSELISHLSSIKNCKSSEDRKRLFEEKKDIQNDIKEIEDEIKLLYQESADIEPEKNDQSIAPETTPNTEKTT
jgi:hypothetical protein